MDETPEATPAPAQRGHSGVTERYLDIAIRNIPVVGRTLERYGDNSVGEYAAGMMASVGKTFQSRQDLWKAVVDYAAPLLGPTVARTAAAELEKTPVALTANHHGVDFFAQSVQGTLFFALTRALQGHTTVPVFAFGNVALNNVTYPRGLLLYGVTPRLGCAGPEKLPLFPSKLNRSMVSAVGPIEPTMIAKAASRARELARLGAVSPKLVGAVEAILEEDYRSSNVLAECTYARQSVLLNRRIWRRLFSGEMAPDLVYLEMEALVAGVLQKDLRNPESLASCVMFDRQVREPLLEALDGERGCWEVGKLERLLEDESLAEGCSAARAGCGTLFFWGVDRQGRRIPLWLDARHKPEKMHGATDTGDRWEIPFSPSALAEGLRDGTLLPSLLTCFLVTALARGVTCLGGYYQAQYLPTMQAAVVSALEVSGAHPEAAALVGQVPTSGYLSGMQAVMTAIDGVGFVPAGPAEIAAVGGLSASDRTRMLDMTVRDAHGASLVDTLPDASPAAGAPGWREALALEAATQLSAKVVLV